MEDREDVRGQDWQRRYCDEARAYWDQLGSLLGAEIWDRFWCLPEGSPMKNGGFWDILMGISWNINHITSN